MNPQRSPLLLDQPVPDHLPGEPAPPVRPTGLAFALRIVGRALFVAVLGALTAPLWPLFLLGVLVWGYPPNVPRPAQVIRYLRHTFAADPPPPGLPVGVRAWLFLSILRKVAVIPVWGLAWQLDEVLYGAQLRAVQVKAPLIEISAARSGSTQLARYLEEDPHLAAPSMLQFVFPYLWLWKLAPHTIGRFITPAQVIHKMEADLPKEFLQRHEGDPFRTDTFDAALFLSHLNSLSVFLGPEVAVPDFGMGVIAPHNRVLWEQSFVELTDGIARKTLLHAGPGPDGQPKRFFVKGHFLAGAEALARRYPDGRFLTMIREPAPRLQSGVNFLRANPIDTALGHVPWSWLGETLSRTETAYCEAEQVWFTRAEGPQRMVIRFSEYVRDLEGTMTRIYRDLLDTPELPPHVPRVHPPRERTNYLLNRSLAQVGVHEAALNARLAGYIAWCRGEG